MQNLQVQKIYFFFPHGKQVSNAETDPGFCTVWGRSFYMSESQEKEKTNVNYDSYF